MWAGTRSPLFYFKGAMGLLSSFFGPLDRTVVEERFKHIVIYILHYTIYVKVVGPTYLPGSSFSSEREFHGPNTFLFYYFITMI